ncbi:hypothetical protein EYF80_015387 [Liparis tanakae]|uniref:Uncharacterized protein n=1 Tax=Liparis tanakae TaxID=230148 RepID=A0A4Z2I8Z1_9TELE|nr:hypothetical protein EYF80_015387 [Liparis tanakae]
MKSPVPSPELSESVEMGNDAISGSMVDPLMEGTDCAIVVPLVISLPSMSGTTDDEIEASLGDTVIELMSVSSEIGGTDGCSVSVGNLVLSFSRLSVVRGDIAVGASVLKREDVAVTDEVEMNISGVGSPEPTSSVRGTLELCSDL